MTENLFLEVIYTKCLVGLPVLCFINSGELFVDLRIMVRGASTFEAIGTTNIGKKLHVHGSQYKFSTLWNTGPYTEKASILVKIHLERFK